VKWSLRREQLCDLKPYGASAGCDDAEEIRDSNGLLLRRERCADCPLDKLDRAVAQDPALHRAYDLDFALTAGIRITLDEIDVEEFRALKVLRIERDKHQAEQLKQNRPS
jgi:hypothetical protein